MSTFKFTDVFTVIPDTKTKVKSSTYLESGANAVVDQGKELISGYTNSSLTVDEDLLPVIVFGDHTRVVKFIDFPFTAGADGTQILKPSELLNRKYAFYMVLFAVSKIPSKGYSRHFSELKKSNVHIPPLADQEEMVRILDLAFLDFELLEINLTSMSKRISALSDVYVQNMFLDSGEFTSEEEIKVRPAGSPRFEVMPLGEVCKIVMGKTPSRGNPRFWDLTHMSGHNWVSIADISKAKDGVITETKEHLSDEGSKLFPKVKKETLLLSFKLSIGKLAIAGSDLQTNEAIAALNELKDEVVLRDYLYFYLYGFDWSKVIEGRFKVKGNTLNKKILESLPIKIPSLDEQRKIVADMRAVFDEVADLESLVKLKINLLRDLRESFLNSAFTSKEDSINDAK